MTGHLPLNSEWHSCTFREELDTGVTSTGRHQKVGGYSRSDGYHGLEGENITVSIKSVIPHDHQHEKTRAWQRWTWAWGKPTFWCLPYSLSSMFESFHCRGLSPPWWGCLGSLGGSFYVSENLLNGSPHPYPCFLSWKVISCRWKGY